jgi:hypothetical protein
VSFADADDGMVGDFHANRFVLPALGIAVLQNDGFARIGDERSDGRQIDIRRAIVDLHSLADKRTVTCHQYPVLGLARKPSMVPPNIRFSYRTLSNN